jgi:hypothetical protein
MTTATATKYAAVAAAADAAGKAAADAAIPTPMIVGTAKAIIGPGADDIDYSKPTYYVPGGVCGFAWVALKGNSGFGRWAKREGIARPGYPSGLMIRANVGGQSYETKMAYAQAYAAVLREHGITAYPQGRLD